MLKRVMFEKLVHLEQNHKWTSVKRQHFLHVRAAYHVFCTKHQGSLSVVCWSLNRYHWPKVAVTTDVFGSVQCSENPTTNFSYYTNLNILLLQHFAEEARIFPKLLLLPVVTRSWGQAIEKTSLMISHLKTLSFNHIQMLCSTMSRKFHFSQR